MSSRRPLSVVAGALVAFTSVACSGADERAVAADDTADVSTPAASGDAESATKHEPRHAETIAREEQVDAGEERLEGVFGQEPASDRMRFEGTYVTLDSGERIILGYSPDPEHAELVGKRVVVIGKPYEPEGRAVGGKHVHARIIRAAD